MNAIGVDPGSGLGIAHAGQVHEPIRASFDSLGVGATVILAQGVNADFETIAIMQVEQAADQMPGWMIAKIRRQVSDPEPRHHRLRIRPFQFLPHRRDAGRQKLTMAVRDSRRQFRRER